MTPETVAQPGPSPGTQQALGPWPLRAVSLFLCGRLGSSTLLCFHLLALSLTPAPPLLPAPVSNSLLEDSPFLSASLSLSDPP